MNSFDLTQNVLRLSPDEIARITEPGSLSFIATGADTLNEYDMVD